MTIKYLFFLKLWTLLLRVSYEFQHHYPRLLVNQRNILKLNLKLLTKLICRCIGKWKMKKIQKGMRLRLDAYLIGRWFMRSDNSYKGPFEWVDEEDVKEDASSVNSDEEEEEHTESIESSSDTSPMEDESLLCSSSSLMTQLVFPPPWPSMILSTQKACAFLWFIGKKWYPRGQEMKQLWWSDKILDPYICKMRKKKIWITLTSFIVFYILCILIVVSMKWSYIWWEIDKL